MWEYNYNTYSEELYHYGVLGMKWGQHKAARRYARQLNRLDRKASNAVGDTIFYDYKANKYANKAAAYVKKKGNNPTEKQLAKLDKLRKKAIGNKKLSDAARKVYEQHDAETWKTIADAAAKGYSVNNKSIMRRTYRANRINSTIAMPAFAITGGGAIPGAITGAIVTGVLLGKEKKYAGKYTTKDPKTGVEVDQSPYRVLGNKYKVKPKK